MPMKTSKSDLAARLGRKLEEAVAEHREDDTDYGGFADLPAGINGGVAQLVDCRFAQIGEGKQNAGEYVFFASGIVVAPRAHNGVPVKGLRTQISEPVYDTPGRARETLADHVGWIMNELAKLGAEREEMSGDTLEAVAEALKQARPFFRFRTWAGARQDIEKGPKGWVVMQDGKVLKGPFRDEAAAKLAAPFAGRDPRTNHQWSGMCDWSEEGEQMVNDQTGSTQRNGTGHRELGEVDGPDGAERVPEPEDVQPIVDLDLDALAASADNGDEEAGETLRTAAEAAGLDPDEVAGAASWVDVVGWLRDRGDGGTGEEDAPEPEPTKPAARGGPSAGKTATAPKAAAKPWEPAKGKVYPYSPVDPKTRKPAARPIQAEVVAVDKAKRTVDLKDLANPRIIHKGVSWDKLGGKPPY